MVALVVVAPWRGSPRPTVAAVPTSSAPPAGRQWVSFHGITLTVPETWQTGTTPCPYSQVDAVLIVTPAGLSCPAPPPSTATLVTLGALVGPVPDGERITLAGHPAVQSDSAYVLPDVGVTLDITSRTVHQAQEVLDTLEYTPVDHLGCRATSPDPTVPTPGTTRPLDDVVGGVVCVYDVGGGLLLGSRTLTAGDLETLRHLVTVAEPGRSATQLLDLRPDHLYRLTTAAGGTRTLTLRLHGSDAEVSDGEHLAVAVATGVPGAYS